VRQHRGGIVDFARDGRDRLGRAQELADGDEPCTATAIGEETIVADAMEPVRQAVDEEAADELVRIERHQPGYVAMTVIAPAEGYAGLVGAGQAAVGDCNPVRVAPEIGEDMFRRSKRRLGLNDPVLAPQLADHGGEGARVVKPIKLAREAQPAGRMCDRKPFEEQASEQA